MPKAKVSYHCFQCIEQLLSHDGMNLKVWKFLIIASSALNSCSVITGWISKFEWQLVALTCMWKLTDIRIFYWLMIHNFVFLVQIFAGGIIKYKDRYYHSQGIPALHLAENNDRCIIFQCLTCDPCSVLVCLCWGFMAQSTAKVMSSRSVTF